MAEARRRLAETGRWALLRLTLARGQIRLALLPGRVLRVGNCAQMPPRLGGGRIWRLFTTLGGYAVGTHTLSMHLIGKHLIGNHTLGEQRHGGQVVLALLVLAQLQLRLDRSVLLGLGEGKLEALAQGQLGG
ncbi:MAG TPA: hypothetical protein VF062_10655 [Candidatus Limnocylindrales bacterium]